MNCVNHWIPAFAGMTARDSGLHQVAMGILGGLFPMPLYHLGGLFQTPLYPWNLTRLFWFSLS